MADVKARIAMAATRFGKMRHIWADKQLHQKLRIRLYRSSVCSIMVYGAEAWRLTEDVRRALNGANARMMSIITGKTPHEEATANTRTFDLVKWIRARRLQWLGHILRMGPERKLKQAIFEMFKDRQEGDMLMDAPTTTSWRELCTYACDRDYWRARVRGLRQSRVRVAMEAGPHIEEATTVPFTIST